MLGSKLKLELIANEKIRQRTFQNRQKGLRKKVHKLSTLCGVEVCMIICCPNGNNTYSSQPCVWPENHYEVERIINEYINKRKKEHGKRTVDLSGVLERQTSETRLELDELSYEKLMEIVNKLDKKLGSVESLIDLKMGETGLMGETLVNCPNHMSGLLTVEPIDIHVAMDDSAFQGSKMVLYDLDFPELSDGGVESDLTWTMMNLENNECLELGGGKTSNSELLYQSDPAHGIVVIQLMGCSNTDPSTSYSNMGTVPTMQGMSVSENTMMFNTSPINSMPQMGLSHNTMPDIDQSISMQQISAYMQYLLA
ncbi:hypothetical protein PVL29_019907 [Vitis rotundifolia]|uniref:MADS-box domain-containing protein n=1 Tax=Vitis rotundifolia TaxID=103349 RepID=A0AA38Z1P5_VITRO|nr:hypothetical protein PVL29_019907 [Vitis rotundifolia]